MQIDKSVILEFLQDRGLPEQASQAAQLLPDSVNLDQAADLLSRFGIDPAELLDKLPGGLGDKLGGLADKLPGGLGDKLGGLFGRD
ncbi:MAG: hypothetical protein QOJ19_3446 [Acidimicrobiia bacterium]|jgi:hypothetical protein|nr:hypothetical protein [Acidimicrobiia bacterium]